MQRSSIGPGRLARRARAFARRRLSPLPAAGYHDHRVSSPLLERLSDEELARLNQLLPWSCFTVDGRGRRFGDAAWTGKREQPQPVPDRRIVLMDERFGLSGSHVLEIGCFEGVHTLGLSQRGARVTAVDARIENVVKTLVRCNLHGAQPTVYPCNIEAAGATTGLASVGADLVHHVGVLYHLRDPIRHLLGLGGLSCRGLMLDTHVARPEQADVTVTVDGESFRGMRYHEAGRADAFSGMYDHALWLPQDVIVDLLGRAGFGMVDVVEERAERNGLRVLVMAGR